MFSPFHRLWGKHMLDPPYKMLPLDEEDLKIQPTSTNDRETVGTERTPGEGISEGKARHNRTIRPRACRQDVCKI